jgi:hypothetical protein
MPYFATEQDDEAIRILTWSMDEALEEARVERETQAEIHRLENEEFENEQQRLMRNGHMPIWTMDELEAMAEQSRRHVGFTRRMALQYPRIRH